AHNWVQNGRAAVSTREISPPRSKIGIGRNDRFESFDGVLVKPAAHKRLAAEELLIGFQIRGSIGDQRFALLQTEWYLQRTCDCLRNVLLRREDVRKLAVVVLRPYLSAVVRFDELCRNADLFAGFAN